VVEDGQLCHLSRTIASSLLVNRRPKLSIVAPNASPEEAAAVVAALERFMRETAPVPALSEPPPSSWQQLALQEGVARQPGPPLPWS
jgi:hypothetical protein